MGGCIVWLMGGWMGGLMGGVMSNHKNLINVDLIEIGGWVDGWINGWGQVKLLKIR